MKQKETFKTIFFLLAILLAVLPFLVILVSFNEFFTHLVERLQLYTWMQDRVVPVQSQLVGVIVRPLGIQYVSLRDGMLVNGLRMQITWNCLGWQSLLLFGISLFLGLKGGSYTFSSKFQVIILGLFAIFWVNLLRISFIVFLAAYTMPLYRIVFHNYLAALTTLVFLIWFWWFAYSFVLEERPSKLIDKADQITIN